MTRERRDRIVDITRPLAPTTAAWPEDTPFALAWTWAIERGDACSVSRWTLSPHVGTHVDAPRHYLADGADVAALPLDRLCGPAEVADLRGVPALDPRTLAARVRGTAPRLLVRTLEGVDPRIFVRDYPPLTPDGARWLVERGVVAFGTDAPSVDPVDSKTLDAHRILGAAGVPILENLELGHVPPGTYRLLALPLRVPDADASPVRAVLWEEPGAEEANL